MSVDPVVLALRAALLNGDSEPLRSALAEHFLKSGDAAESLAEAEAGLRLDAGHAGLLVLAARAAEAAGEAGKAAAYRLAGASAPPPVAAAPLAASTAGRAGDDADVQRDEEASAAGAGRPALRVVMDADDDVEEAPPLRFSDVGGMEDVKLRLTRSFLQPLKNPELYRKFGKRIGGGLVLYGPPGVGKTYIARALAGEIGARFMSVGLNDVLDMWLGESEKKLHELFETARRRAPTLLFFDEIDALGQRRSNLKASAGRNVVNQLLSELDGIGGKSEEVFFLAATNHPWDLDPALRRPGRFDRLLFVPPPDLKARQEVLALKLRERPTGKIDLVRLAKATEGYSGADLGALIDAALDLAIEKSLATGREAPVDDAFLHTALKGQRPSIRPWFETARNYALYSNEGGTYDELLEHLRQVGLT